jgi:hypothetical protein
MYMIRCFLLLLRHVGSELRIGGSSVETPGEVLCWAERLTSLNEQRGHRGSLEQADLEVLDGN